MRGDGWLNTLAIVLAWLLQSTRSRQFSHLHCTESAILTRRTRGAGPTAARRRQPLLSWGTAGERAVQLRPQSVWQQLLRPAARTIPSRLALRPAATLTAARRMDGMRSLSSSTHRAALVDEGYTSESKTVRSGCCGPAGAPRRWRRVAPAPRVRQPLRLQSRTT